MGDGGCTQHFVYNLNTVKAKNPSCFVKFIQVICNLLHEKKSFFESLLSLMGSLYLYKLHMCGAHKNPELKTSTLKVTQHFYDLGLTTLVLTN